MAFKSIQGSAKQSLLDYFVSGKAVQYHSAEKGLKAELPSGLTATGGVISDYTDGSMFIEHTSLLHQVLLM
jgi:hypothetical protein